MKCGKLRNCSQVVGRRARHQARSSREWSTPRHRLCGLQEERDARQQRRHQTSSQQQQQRPQQQRVGRVRRVPATCWRQAMAHPQPQLWCEGKYASSLSDASPCHLAREAWWEQLRLQQTRSLAASWDWPPPVLQLPLLLHVWVIGVLRLLPWMLLLLAAEAREWAGALMRASAGGVCCLMAVCVWVRKGLAGGGCGDEARGERRSTHTRASESSARQAKPAQTPIGRSQTSSRALARLPCSMRHLCALAWAPCSPLHAGMGLATCCVRHREACGVDKLVGFDRYLR